jgi:hypothetical protein
MNVEEPVFNIIHNFRRPGAQARRPPHPPLENDSEQLELAEPLSTDTTLHF